MLYFVISWVIAILLLVFSLQNNKEVGANFSASNLLVQTIMILWVLLMMVGTFFYYRSFPYWKRRDYWDRFTWIGVITMSRQISRMQEPGKTYAKFSLNLMGCTPLVFILLLLVFKLLHMI